MSVVSRKCNRKISRDNVHYMANETIVHDYHHVRVFPVSSFSFVLQNFSYQSQPALLVHMIAMNAATAFRHR